MGWRRLSIVFLIIAILCLVWAGFMGWLLIVLPADAPLNPRRWLALFLSAGGSLLAFAGAWVASGFAKDAASS